MDQIKAACRSLSLRKSIAVYITLFCLLALVLCIITASLCDYAKKRIEEKYPVTGERYYLTNEQGERLGEGSVIGTASMPLTKSDEKMIALLDLIRMLCVPVYSAVCITGAALLFYRDRLKKPLELLNQASRKIAENDLDFSVKYDSRDEMGQLCGSFELMRSALSSNISQMGRQMEERKRLNAAFAHDLRTPLTVLKGYNEMLQASKEDLTRSVAVTMGKHIERLEHYVESMSRLRRLEDAKPECRKVLVSDFVEGLRESAEMICGQKGKAVHLVNHIEAWEIFIDAELVSQVCTNLISNAARYAEQLVSIEAQEMEGGIRLSVADDGKGFGEDTLQYVTDPYYTKEQDHFEHFGLGLYICKVLCEHHGGSLSVQNMEKGAKVTANFNYDAR